MAMKKKHKRKGTQSCPNNGATKSSVTIVAMEIKEHIQREEADEVRGQYHFYNL